MNNTALLPAWSSACSRIPRRALRRWQDSGRRKRHCRGQCYGYGRWSEVGVFRGRFSQRWEFTGDEVTAGGAAWSRGGGRCGS
jgi:hypothetical protein